MLATSNSPLSSSTFAPAVAARSFDPQGEPCLGEATERSWTPIPTAAGACCFRYCGGFAQARRWRYGEGGQWIQVTPQDEINSAIEAADRAGSIVSDHVRSIIDAAQARAADLEQEAEREADEIKGQALEAANSVLKRIDSIEGQLGSLVGDLRKQTDSLSGGLDRRPQR